MKKTVLIRNKKKRSNYGAKVQKMFGAALLAYWPLQETSGLTAFDLSGNGRNALYKNTGVTQGQPGIGDRKTSVSFDGMTGNLNTYSSGLRDVFNGQECSICLWMKIPAASWSGTNYCVFAFLANGSNYIKINLGGSANRLNAYYSAGGASKSINIVTFNDSTYMPVVFTISKTNDRIRFYANGNRLSSQTSVGTYTGSLGSTYCWLATDQPGQNMNTPCSLAHVAIVGREITSEEVYYYSEPVYKSKPKFYLDFGDSRQTNRGWQAYLNTNLKTAQGLDWKETPLGASGSTSITWQAAIDGELAERHGQVDAVLYNMGVNDASGGTSEATFKTNTLYILDAMHAKYPDAKIYMARVWKRSTEAACASVNTWINTLIAQRPFTYAGPDETVWAKGSDNGVTMTSDGLHYNAAGLIENAAQWARVIQ